MLVLKVDSSVDGEGIKMEICLFFTYVASPLCSHHPFGMFIPSPLKVAVELTLQYR